MREDVDKGADTSSGMGEEVLDIGNKKGKTNQSLFFHCFSMWSREKDDKE